MKTFIIIILILTIFKPSYLGLITYITTIGWCIYFLCFIYKLHTFKDKKIKTNNSIALPPNNTYPPYIRYLYSGKIDYKVFLLIVIDLIKKGSISIKKEDRIYYLIDNKLKEEVLSNSEKHVKKILFKDIGTNDYVILNTMIKKCNFNSGYLYEVYKEWKDIFFCEVSSKKYFKSNKKILDNSTNFLILSFIISLLNVLITRYIFIALIIFSIAAIICKYINDINNREIDAKDGYVKWLEFKNYLDNQEIDVIDEKLLESYTLYSYALDSYNNFKNILNKYSFKEDNILNILKEDAFLDIDYLFKKSIGKLGINAIILFKKNNGRR